MSSLPFKKKIFDPSKTPHQKIRKPIFLRYRRQSVPKHCTKLTLSALLYNPRDWLYSVHCMAINVYSKIPPNQPSQKWGSFLMQIKWLNFSKGNIMHTPSNAKSHQCYLKHRPNFQFFNGFSPWNIGPFFLLVSFATLGTKQQIFLLKHH